MKNKQAVKLNTFFDLSKLNSSIDTDNNKRTIKTKNENKNESEEEYIIDQKKLLNNNRNNSDNISNISESEQSTILDQGNYYYDIIMSKNILFNNILNNIDESYIDINNNNNNKEDINKLPIIKEKEIKKNENINIIEPNNNISNENIKNDININEDIYQKCKETLERFNKIFSDFDMQKFINKYKKNPDKKNNENIEINQNNKEENNNDINNENEEIIIKIPKEDKKNNINENNNEKIYNFSEEELEKLYQIFISLDDYINLLIKQNAFNTIKTYGNKKTLYNNGIEYLILIIKSYPFNLLRMSYQREYYKDFLRQIFMPYIRKAYNNISLYVYNKARFTEANKIIEQIYKFNFLKELINYVEKKERQKKLNEFIKLLVTKMNYNYKNYYYNKFCDILKKKEDINKNEISNDSSAKKYNSYLYESLSDKSSLTAYPNTEKTARLHKVYELLEMQEKLKLEENNNYENINNIINKSAKSQDENKSINIFENIKEKNDLDIINENLIIEENKINNNEKESEISNNLKLDKNEPIENNIIINPENNNEKKEEINDNNKNKNILEETKDTNHNNNEEKNNINNYSDKLIENNKIDNKNLENKEITKENEDNNKEDNNKEITEKKDNDNLNDNINDLDNNKISLNLNLDNDINKLQNDNININNNRYEFDNESEKNENDNNKIIKNLDKNSIEKIEDDLCQNIIKELLLSEINNNKKLFTRKKKEIDISLNNNNSNISLQSSQNNNMSIGSLSPGRKNPKKNIKKKTNNKNKDIYPIMNNNQTDSMLNNNILMRTMDEIKKDKKINTYNEKLVDKFLEEIKKKLEDNYDNIIENLKIPLEIDEEEMINGLLLKDENYISTTKIKFKNENILKNNFINENILSEFEKENKENIYDKILNKCIYDTINELIEKERKYGKIGSPLSWSIRSKHIGYKYKKEEILFKNIFITKIMNEIKQILEIKMGLIPENYKNKKKLNKDKDKKFTECIKQELIENEISYQIYEIQETNVKLNLSKILYEQLLNEIVEILEHIHNSRKYPEKYQSQSIYTCEEIPRLSFQPQQIENNENNSIGNYEEEIENNDKNNK